MLRTSTRERGTKKPRIRVGLRKTRPLLAFTFRRIPGIYYELATRTSFPLPPHKFSAQGMRNLGMTPSAQTRRSAVVLTTVLPALLAGVALAACFEWKHYAKFLDWRAQHLPFGDKAALFCLLWAKTLWVLGPLTLASGALAWLGRSRLAALVMGLNTVLVALWLLLNIRVQRVTGNHIHSYFSFLASDEVLAWGGKTSIAALLRPTKVLLCVVGFTLAVFAARHAIHRAALMWTRLGNGWAATAAVLGFASVALGAVPATKAIDKPLLLEAFADALPVPVKPLLVSRSPADPLAVFRDEFRGAVKPPLYQISKAILSGQPIDTETRLDVPHPPNVYLIIVESLRADALSRQHMPQLDRWAQRGMRFLKHYAGTNVSHFGMFTLLYGRSPMVYELTLNAGLPPQLTTTFKKSGYRCAYLSGGTLPWARMEEFINASTFDEVHLSYEREWADRDRCVLRQLQGLARDGSSQPRLNVVFLIASHYDYDYPKEYERHLPVVQRNSGEADSKQYRAKLFNRYRNSLAFLDDEISNLIERLDPAKNLIVITGDHGESFMEDGVYTHNSKGSDAQTHVPLAIVGPGVPRATVTGFTRHADLVPTLLHLVAGKPVPLRHSHGKDVVVDGGRDRTVLFTTPRAPEGYKLLLLRGAERFRVHVMLGRHPYVDAEGYYDASDRLQVGRTPGRADINKWRDVVLEELSLMAD